MHTPPFPPPAPAIPKKGLSGLAWAGIGCGGVLLVAILIGAGLTFFGVKKYKEFQADKDLALAEMIVATHPDLEKVSSDPGKGEITVRSKSGEEYTVNYKEITQGRFSFKDAEGKITRLGGSDDLTEVPAWVPRPASIEGTPSVFHSVTAGKAAGLYNATSSQSLEELQTFFTEELDKGGFGASTSGSTEWGGSRNISLSRSSDAREVSVALTQEGTKPVTLQVTYKEK